MGEDTITPKEAAIRLGTSTDNVYAWCRSGRLQCWKRTRGGIAFRHLRWVVEIEGVRRLCGGPATIARGLELNPVPESQQPPDQAQEGRG